MPRCRLSSLIRWRWAIWLPPCWRSAFLAMVLVVRNSSLARPLVWCFDVVGAVDLGTSIMLATVYKTPVFMGLAYWIPAFCVPSLLVTHFVTFVVVFKYWKGQGTVL